MDIRITDWADLEVAFWIPVNFRTCFFTLITTDELFSLVVLFSLVGYQSRLQAQNGRVESSHLTVALQKSCSIIMHRNLKKSL